MTFINKINADSSAYLFRIFFILFTVFLQVNSYAQSTPEEEENPDPVIDLDSLADQDNSFTQQQVKTSPFKLTDSPINKKNPVTSLLSFTSTHISSSICVNQNGISGCASNANVSTYRGIKFGSICAIAEGPAEYVYSLQNNLILTARNIYILDRNYNNKTHLLFYRSTHMNLISDTRNNSTRQHQYLQRLEKSHFNDDTINEAIQDKDYGEVALRLGTADSLNPILPSLPSKVAATAQCFLVATRNVVFVGNRASSSIYRFILNLSSSSNSPFHDKLKVDPTPMKSIINENKPSYSELDSTVTNMYTHEDGRVFVKTQKSVWIFAPDGELITVEELSAIK
jgi:hypothetical protein